MITYVIKPDDDGIRLDRWFKRHRPDVTHALLARWARTGMVKLDGKRCEAGDRIGEGDILTVPPTTGVARGIRSTGAPRQPVSPEDAALAEAMVIHKDASAIVLNKVPGLATQGGTGITRHVDGLLDALCFERDDRPKLVHRLDKDTSGVLLLARTSRAAAVFARSFSGRDAKKTYWALVMGVPDSKEGIIDAPLAKQPGSGGEKMHIDEAEGQPAKTRFRVIERAGNRATWLELEPQTGRTHQLRVHCAAIGHPIVGDAKYGGKEAFLTGGISRKMHLHARRLRIGHPDGGTLDVSADLPTHMAESFAMLGFDLGRPVELAEQRKLLADIAAAKPKPKPKPVRRGERRSRGAAEEVVPKRGPTGKPRRPKRPAKGKTVRSGPARSGPPRGRS
jgi:23S rRNA pseudouridine955/2504/2580 synthase